MVNDTDEKQSVKEDAFSAKAVLLGALAPGVNLPTLNTLRIVFLMLGLCLLAILAVAYSSYDFALVAHMMMLLVICMVLFLLLMGFLSQTGLVTVEHQMQEMGLAPDDQGRINKKTN